MNLARGRIDEINISCEAKGCFKDYFEKVSGFIGMLYKVFDEKLEGKWENKSLSNLKTENAALYADITGDAYATSYANPDYAAKTLGEKYGPLLGFLYSEIRGMIGYTFEGNFELMTIFSELFLEIYLYFEEDAEPLYEDIKGVIYSFFHDYSEVFSEIAVRNNCDSDLCFVRDIVTEEDLSDLRYLYKSGIYISENELKMAEYLSSFSEEEIQKMADTFTEGYRKGFELAGIKMKGAVGVHFAAGFERIIKAAIKNFEDMGLKSVIYQSPLSSYFKRSSAKSGYVSTSANRQYDFDHANDQAFYMDKSFVNRRLETLKSAYEKYSDKARVYSGPAVMETFGEKNFEPVNKEAAASYDKKQQELRVYYANESMKITQEYIPGDERSFTIIAYPVPDIGEDFEAIFKKTAEINTLDYVKYRDIQQHLIDALDKGERVKVKGCGENRTDMTVELYKLSNPKEETIFENCVADVNIPVGEVFTSPVLEGTNGTLHVSQVYLNGLKYRDLFFDFENGKTVAYGCKNFEDDKENEKYIRENVLFDHESLPIGEFAIGTNTLAYKMGKEFGIFDKLPILIAEKTGPHFALGDTCYSHQEDMVTKNPDGKKIVARDNSVSVLRKTDMSKAYMNCHTDITIPFEELAYISVECADGTMIDLIKDGRFVLPGTEELNESL
ncbi:MAG: aminopeptidase [Eubacterium sp.]|nr:aminopeptidase [Eubacterium sp.]